MRQARGVVEYLLVGCPNLRILGDWVPGVQVTVEARKVAAGDIHSYAVALQEYVAGRPEVDSKLVHFSRLQQRLVLLRRAVAPPYDAVAQV